MGFAGNYADIIFRILNHKDPDFFDVATSTTDIVHELVRIVLNEVGLNSKFSEFIETSIKLIHPQDAAAHVETFFKHQTGSRVNTKN